MGEEEGGWGGGVFASGELPCCFDNLLMGYHDMTCG